MVSQSQPCLNAVQQTRAIGIAATGRVDDGFRFGCGDGDLLSIGIDQRTVRAQRDDQRFHTLRDLVQCLAGLVLQHLGLVIVYGDVSRLFDERQQFRTREHRHALTRIEHERNAKVGKFQRVLKHARRGRPAKRYPA